jgi:transcriptional regulator with XRE-family HTH domain
MDLDGNRVRGLLVMHGITVGVIARRLGVSDSYVSQQIGGLRVMTSETAGALRELLGREALAWASKETDVLRIHPRELRAPSSTDTP